MSSSQLTLSEELLQDTGRKDKLFSSGKLGQTKKDHTRKLIRLRHSWTAYSLFPSSAILLSNVDWYSCLYSLYLM
jgi:hypothetical protein